ncbi:PAS-domain containing protein [Roseobacteraceae bacterium S113]
MPNGRPQSRTDALTQSGLNLIGQAFSICDADLKLAVCNTRFAEMFDLPEAYSTPGADFGDLVRYLATRGEYGPVEDIDRFVQARVDQALAFKPHYMERQRSNGRWISVEGAPLAEGGWVTVYTDITETRAQEELLRTRSEALSEEVLRRSEELSQTNRELAATVLALEETQRRLKASEARTRLTTEMVPAHIAHIGPDNIYTYSNQRLSAVLPGRPSDIVGRSIADALGPSSFAKVAPYVDAAHRGKQSVFEFTEETSGRRIRVSFTPDPTGGVYILSMDITEETQSRAALQHSRRRALAAQVTSGLAHDFSNLLTIILGMQSKLEATQDLPPAASELIAATQAAARRGGRLLTQIGDMTGARTWQPKPVDMAQLVADLMILARPSLPANLTLEATCDVKTPLHLDPGMVQDALLNLILNARDACEDAGTITLSARAEANTWLVITLEDTGPGFSQTALEHAFEPFFSTKGGEGTGLGLVMVYDTAKLAGGDVRLANSARGAQVRIRLPLRPVGTARREMVLLVEDSPDLREGFRTMLTELGHAVIEASSAIEARSLAESVPEITAVLSDIVLEGDETGLDLAAALPSLPVTLMTSLPPHDPRHQAARDMGAVLAKPFAPAQLVAALARPETTQ